MLRPVNGHILISPLKHDSFMASEKGIYEEIGIVIDVAESAKDASTTSRPLQKGDKVYFDSYLAAKYPKNDREFYWLVRWEDVRGIEQNEEIPK